MRRADVMIIKNLSQLTGGHRDFRLESIVIPKDSQRLLGITLLKSLDDFTEVNEGEMHG